MNKQEIKHLGYTYSFELDIEPQENCKILHEAIQEATGESKMLDFSPYEKMNLETFQMLVALNFPPRQGSSPHNKASVLAMWVAKKNK